MSARHIVIVTETIDPHSDILVIKLRKMGYEPIRLNTDDIPINTTMNFCLDRMKWKGYIKVLNSRRTIDISNIRSIWWRRPDEYKFPTEWSKQECEFATMEIHHALGGLWVSLRDDCYWMSYPAAIRQASFKGGQLKRAAELGFDVPRTLITTAPEEAKAFIESCQNQVIFKVMSDPFLAEAKVMDSKDINGFYETTKTISRETSTTLITEQEISLLESVRYVNCQFQEFIPKKIELRITIIGDEIFAAEIHSQAHEKTKIDWRHYHVEIPYRKATLPLDLQSRCIEFVRSYNLNFSAMDFILTPDGRYVFIESNPNGQFLFIEQQIPELRMADALASCLIHGSNQCC